MLMTRRSTGLAAALLLAGGLYAPRLQAQGQAAGAAPEAPSLLPPGETGAPLYVEGRILGTGGPVGGAALYVYQTDARGIYSNEVNDDNTKPRLKARFWTGVDGRFAFSTIMPGQYPRSGPPAHIHLEVTPTGRPVERYEIVFAGDSRMSDAIKADARAGKFYFLCTPTEGAGGVKECRDVTFRLP
jgi:protocatechuate 3,4-dioxygenase beta subunit